jgi:hypothetical protein
MGNLRGRIRGWLPNSSQSEKGFPINPLNTGTMKRKFSSGSLRAFAFAAFGGAVAVDFCLGFLLSNSLITASMFQTSICIVFMAMLGVWAWAIQGVLKMNRSSQQTAEVNP